MHGDDIDLRRRRRCGWPLGGLAAGAERYGKSDRRNPRPYDTQQIS